MWQTRPYPGRVCFFAIKGFLWLKFESTCKLIIFAS